LPVDAPAPTPAVAEAAAPAVAPAAAVPPAIAATPVAATTKMEAMAAAIPPVAPVHGPAPDPAPSPAPVPVAPPVTAAQAGATPAAPAPLRAPPPPLIDSDVLDELRALLGGEVDRLIDVFLEDTPRLISELENAASNGPDYAALRDAAHSLKSSSANLGAMSLSAAAKRIEMGARQQSLERPAVAVALVANEFQRTRQVLRATQGSATDSA